MITQQIVSVRDVQATLPYPITNNQVIMWTREGKALKYEYDNGDYLLLYRTDEQHMFVADSNIACLKLLYMQGNSMWQPQFFYTGQAESAAKAFIKRLQSDDPKLAVEANSISLKDINVMNKRALVFYSHYDYLEAVIEAFWKEMTGRSHVQVGCGGIIGAHGDKCYTYRWGWEKAGIPFGRGVLIYLLSYTGSTRRDLEEAGKTFNPEHWVIEQYPKLVKRIERAERRVLKYKYGIDDLIDAEEE